jgi:hypothetical protein
MNLYAKSIKIIVLLASKEVQTQKEAHISSRKRKRSEETSMPRSSTTPLNKRTRISCEYEIEPQPWIRKEINAYALKQFLVSTIIYVFFARSFTYFMSS